MDGWLGPDPGLGEMLDAALRLLARGAADRRSPLHTPAIATIDRDGLPQVRTLVLRAFDRERRTVRFHTDTRSPKWRELEATPAVSILGYDPGAKLQLRIAARASLHHGDAVAEAAWRGAQPMSRLCYGTMPAPGDAIPSGGAFTLPASAEEAEAGRVHFGAVLCRMERLDLLHLAHGGHRRAAFAWSGETWEGTWLVP